MIEIFAIVATACTAFIIMNVVGMCVLGLAKFAGLLDVDFTPRNAMTAHSTIDIKLNDISTIFAIRFFAYVIGFHSYYLLLPKVMNMLGV